jgi:hypothetical protein
VAAVDLSNWVPIPVSSQTDGTVQVQSAIATLGALVNLTADTEEVPLLAGADIGGGDDLTDDTNDGQKTTVYSYQFNGKQTINEREAEDVTNNPMEAYAREWRSSLNAAYDIACIGVSGARSGTITDYRPYTSIYKEVRTTNATRGYTADANYATGALTYATSSSTMALVETGDYWDDEAMVWLAHPSLREDVRNIKDTSGRPIFIDNGGTVQQDRLHNRPIYWTRGARKSVSFKTSAGNPLLVYVNRRYLKHGLRIAPQSRFIPASANPTALKHVLQHRARYGFALAVPQAAAVLEVSSSS